MSRPSHGGVWPVIALLSLGGAVGAVLRDQTAPVFAGPAPMIAEDVYFGIRPGMMVPYFGAGDTPPKGFVLADGAATWPDAEWVPKDLRGKNVPDMRGELIGGAADVREVGAVWADGKLALSVEGKHFTVPDGVTVPRTSVDMVHWVRGGQVPGTFAAPGKPNAQVKFVNIDHSLMTYKGNVKGNQDIVLAFKDKATNPRHLRCRWVIRVE